MVTMDKTELALNANTELYYTPGITNVKLKRKL